MTDEEESERTNADVSTPTRSAFIKLGIAVVISAVILFLLVLVLYPLILHEGSKGGDYGMWCDKQEDFEQEEPSFEIKRTWIRSANITSYEDIPENEKNNLSNEAKEALKNVSSFWYNGTYYQNLSEKEKDIFNTSINDMARLNRSELDRYVFANSLILYGGDIYYCDADRISRGA